MEFSPYGTRSRVLSGVSLAVGAQQHVALVGESGCGKSVTMRAIMGILRSGTVTGRILFEGRDLLTLPRRERQKLSGTALSMVFQDPTTALNPVFTIGDQMATILKYADRRLGRRRGRAERAARIAEVLGQVRMADPERIARAYPIMLSGGMRQRVLIAMALLNEPRLLIADEPGTALDVTTQAQILALLQELVRERRLALLMITHNLGVVRETADHVHVMYAGAVVEHGPTRAIFEHPRHPYTRALIDCVPRLSGAASLRGIPGAVPDYADPPPGCRFQPRCPHARSACGVPQIDRLVGPDHGVACVLAAEGGVP